MWRNDCLLVSEQLPVYYLAMLDYFELLYLVTTPLIHDFYFVSCDIPSLPTKNAVTPHLLWALHCDLF